MLDRKKGASAADHHLGLTSVPSVTNSKAGIDGQQSILLGEDMAPLESQQHMFEKNLQSYW